jgi:hypothetical protein
MAPDVNWGRERRGFIPARILFFALLILASDPLPAQTAAELEAILETSTLTCAQAARFVLAGAGQADADTFEKTLAKGWFSRGTAAEDPVTLGALSFLVMRAFGIRGGFMYALLPGPRYAFRTMVSRSFIQGTADPAMTVSGERFLLILGNVLSRMGDEQ